MYLFFKKLEIIFKLVHDSTGESFSTISLTHRFLQFDEIINLPLVITNVLIHSLIFC